MAKKLILENENSFDNFIESQIIFFELPDNEYDNLIINNKSFLYTNSQMNVNDYINSSLILKLSNNPLVPTNIDTKIFFTKSRDVVVTLDSYTDNKSVLIKSIEVCKMNSNAVQLYHPFHPKYSWIVIRNLQLKSHIIEKIKIIRTTYQYDKIELKQNEIEMNEKNRKEKMALFLLDEHDKERQRMFELYMFYYKQQQTHREVSHNYIMNDLVTNMTSS